MGKAKEGGSKPVRKLTGEQEAILRSEGNIRINAVAGSGKTTTLIEYARTRPAGARILYLAFNRAVKLEAARRFAEEGLPGVTVETAHSLAYRHVVFRNGYTVRASGYKTHEIAALLGLKSNGEKHAEYIIANHISRFTAYFCNSAAARVADLDYRTTVTDPKARAFVTAFYPTIEEGTRQLLARMNAGSIEITHDFYLKKFQLAAPALPYDYILFDEGQDASGAMLDLFLRQPAVKVIVGDTHQQIYGWRYAVNALEGTSFPDYPLSHSFRFGQPVARLAREVLQWKKHFGPEPAVRIEGKGKATKVGTRATIARTNLGLLLQAITFIDRPGRLPPVYFEGNLNSYTYADEGASLYDVLSLYNGRRQGIRDPLVGTMQTLEDLEEYIEKTGDLQLGVLVDIVREYGNEIPGYLKTLKEQHTGDEERHRAEMYFSTVHRCKGLEYDEVTLAPDFISEPRLLRTLAEKKEGAEPDTAKLNEEINLLYVALTRAKVSIHLPETLLPAGFPSFDNIKVLPVARPSERKERPAVPEVKPAPRRLRKISGEEKAALLGRPRSIPSGQQKPWTAAQDRELRRLYGERVLLRQIARELDRTEEAVLQRIRRLELED
ncbi:MAG TPA: UvrD-helicase domain-containing protein [Chitinophagaceae bacterium]|nr:UvrD-helicase domain-containing protein [Chitinophagaceae bacterium]